MKLSDLKLGQSFVFAVNRPPKKWWDSMYKEIKEGNPSYSDEQIRSTIGDIWFHNLSDSKRKEITKREE